MKSSAYEFSSRVDHQIEALSTEDYHRRIGRSKRLREELYPLSRLALHLKQPGTTVEVEAFEDSGRADGCIRITGFFDSQFEVQVTYAGYGGKDALRDKLLVSEGVSPCAGEIEREKGSGRIVATMGVVDCDEHVTRIASAVLERFYAKVRKSYAPGTVLLIAFDEVKLKSRTNWDQLFSAVDGQGGMSDSPFAQVYLFNGSTNELRRAA